MAIEKERGCGYRKVGGLYLCGRGHGLTCDRLPFELEACPTCGAGVKFTRGFTWLDWVKYAGNHMDCGEQPLICPACAPSECPQPYGLLWIGEAFYTPQSFILEAMELGVSRRIAAIPHKLKLGQSWILCAHISACGRRRSVSPPFAETGVPGILYAFRPTSIEKLIWQRDATPELLEELKKDGIAPIIIPDGDLDHSPETSLKPTSEEKSKLLFGRLRAMLGGLTSNG